MLLFLCTALLSNIFLHSVRSPRFLFCLYVMRGSCSNAVLRSEFTCNKYQCLLIITYFLFSNVLLYIQTQERSHWGTMDSPLRFPSQTRSTNFSFKHQRYCFLPMFRNYTDQKFHNIDLVCYNFWTIYGGFSFFLTT